MTDESLLRIDVEKRTTRGRACPRCGGKIIPSNRAVYQATNPEESFPIWQCERCGYEEMSATKAPPGKKVAPGSAPAAALAAPKAKVLPDMLDAKGRVLPSDVRAIMLRMGNTDAPDA